MKTFWTDQFISRSRYSGSFERSFRIPVNVKPDKVGVIFDKGILKVTLPKEEKAGKKEIEIKEK